jgi:hypothetical protein
LKTELNFLAAIFAGKASFLIPLALNQCHAPEPYGSCHSATRRQYTFTGFHRSVNFGRIAQRPQQVAGGCRVIERERSS